jgi:23S rRNA (guanosine2251-2'-O)-methyltransferase
VNNQRPKKPSEDWIWGFHSVEACADCSPELILEVFVEKKAFAKNKKPSKSLEQLRVSQVERLPRFLEDKRTQGIAAKIKKFPLYTFGQFLENSPQAKHQILILDRIQDPQNFGAILRSAAALGVEAVIIGSREQCSITGTVALVSAGNLFRLKIYQSQNLNKAVQDLKEEGYQLYALESGKKQLSALSAELKEAQKWGWVLGAEEDGIQSSIVKNCHESVGIPMSPGVESLNVSNSAAIALYEGYKILKN